HNWAFFPLFPLLLRGAAKITGEYPLTGMALSNLFFFLALIVVYKSAAAFGYDGCGDATVFFIAAFPVSYFFSLAQTESLFLLLTAASLYAARRDYWWIAGACGALASATRLAGIFLLIPLAILWWQRTGEALHGRNLRSRVNVLALVFMPGGLVAFMI